MKMTSFLLFVACLQVSAKAFSQTVTFSGKNVTLEKIFTAVEKQTGYVFFFDEKVLKDTKPVSIQVNNMPLEDFLTTIFKDQPLKFSFQNKTIVIARKATAVMTATADRQPGIDTTGNFPRTPPPPIDIRGMVTNADGVPLAGASIKVQGTKKGTYTDEKGNFILKEIDDDAVLEISYVGYQPLIIKANKQTYITAGLIASNNQLDESVIIGYGTTTKRFNTGSVSKVTAADIEKQPVGNILNALQGLVPGLDIVQSTGYSSGQYNVLVRGRKNLFSVPSNPLIIVDGVPLPTSNGDVNNVGLNQNQIFGPNSGQNPFFGINPSDIESIEVLKDADATSIYGSRGANGVILITTKKSKPGSSGLNANFYAGVTTAPKRVKLLDTKQYLAMRREAFKNSGITPDIFNAPDLLVWDTTAYTDWQKELASNTTAADAQLGYSGGNANTRFRINGAYHKEGVPVPKGIDEKYKNDRYSIQLNLDHASVDRKFNAATIIGYTTTNDYAPSYGFYQYDLPPNAPAFLDSAGNLNWTKWGYNLPYVFTGLFQPYKAYTTNLTGNVTLSYNFFKGFVVTASIGYTNTNMEQLAKYPASSQDPDPLNGVSQAQYGTNNVRSWIAEPRATYTTRLGDGNLQVMAGSTFTESITKGENITGSGYVNESLISNMGSAASLYAINNYSQYLFQGYFTRVNYNWKQKYILNLAGRIDGSSRFKPGDQFGTFGSAGAAWLFSEESLVKKNLPFVSFGKLRGSYGTTGSPAASDYQYLELWRSLGTYAGNTALALTQPFNPGFKWQVNKKLDIGLELGFLQDRISFIAEWYTERTGNQLVNYPLPAYTGLFPIVQNLPAEVENKGWEFLLRTINIQSKNLTWTSSFNISLNRNKLIAFPGIELTGYAGTYAIGYPLTIRKSYHFTGVDQQTGLYTFEDVNHDNVINDADRTAILDLTPAFTGGFQNSIQYKGWQVNFLLDFKKQKGPYSISNDRVAGSMVNQPVEILNRWQKPGDNTDISKFTPYGGSDFFNYTVSDARIVNASYLRLQNVSLAYDLPIKLFGKAKITGCKIYVQGQNLLTFSSYKGINPINPSLSNTNFPPQRIFTGGIQLTL